MRGLAVSIKNVSRRYGDIVAVADVALEIGPGEFVSLLGPSGSGKTTLLMMLAGFEQPQSGALFVGDRDITKVPPNLRNISMVFQRYALFPHMTVTENIAFPLRMRGVQKPDQLIRIQKALEMVKLDGYGSRKPAELSGGQQQRVALARAIVSDPPVILMDEPLGALDKKLRVHMQTELKQLQQRLGSTVIYVTHDQEEALTMSDQVAVMNHGKVMQYGPPRELYEAPANEFVADFIGDMNFVTGTVRRVHDGIADVEVPGGNLSVAVAPSYNGNSRTVRVAVRPENISVAPSSDVNGVQVVLAQKVFNGSHTMLHCVLADGGVVRASVSAHSPLTRMSAGETLTLTCPPSGAHLFSGARR